MNNKQTGSALIISLLILLVMTMVGINSLNTSTLEEKMASNDRNQKLLFQNAETNLRTAEGNVGEMAWSTGLYKAIKENQQGYFDLSDAKVDYFSNNSWNSGAGGSCIGVPTGIANPTACYVVELLAGPVGGGGSSRLNTFEYGSASNTNDPGFQITKITLRNTDSSGGKVILQSTHQKQAMD